MSALVLRSERKNQLDSRFAEIFSVVPERYFSGRKLFLHLENRMYLPAQAQDIQGSK